MKATEQYFPVVLFISRYGVVKKKKTIDIYTFGMTGASTTGAGDSSSVSDSLSSKSVKRTRK